MKRIASGLAMLSLLSAAPALASDVSSDRHFAETKASPGRALQSSSIPAEARRRDSPTVDKDGRSRCSCARSDAPRSDRTDPGGR